MTVSAHVGQYPSRVELLLRAMPMVVAVALVMTLVTVGLDLPALKTVAFWAASWTGLALTALGVQATVDGTVVASETFAVNVVAECLALGPMLLYAGAVLAYPRGLRSKALGLLVGITVIAGVNLVRITSLFLLGSAYPHLLGPVHLVLWQSLMALLAIAVWLLWAQGRLNIGGLGPLKAELLTKVFWATAVLLLLAIAWLGVARDYNHVVAGLASALAGDGVSISAAGAHLLIGGTAGGGPISVSGFTMQWGVLLLASVIAVTSTLAFRARAVWLISTVGVAYLMQAATTALLGLVLAWAAQAGPPLLGRLGMGAFAVFWGIGPIVLAGIWCLALWKPAGLVKVSAANTNKTTGRVGI